MIRHIRIHQLRRLRLHHLIKPCLLIAQAANQLRVSEAEAAELQCFGVVDGVGHDGAYWCAEPISNIGVRTVGEREGLESGATGAYCVALALWRV